MYTSYIGLKFLEIYNQRNQTSLSAAEFFESVMFPLFFDDQRHLMHVSNSPFFQTPSEKDLKQSGLSKSAYQYEKLKQKVMLITQEAEEEPDASVYVGFAANGPDQTTAGQVSNIKWKITAEELYASWIGNALSIRVEGSQCLLIESDDVLWHLYEGWQLYRKYMEPLRSMEGRQIETWNGYWLAHGENNKAITPPEKNGKIDTTPWVPVIAKLLQWHSGQLLPAYVFSLGQTNTTYGFINIHLPQIARLRELRHAVKKTLMAAENEDDEFFWRHYEPEFSLREVCQIGEIGLRGLRPKDYAKLMDENLTTLKVSDKNRQTLSNIQIWILAMLNNKTELQSLAAQLATELVAAESSGSGKDRGKTSDSADIKALLESKGLNSFIGSLTDFLEKRSAAAEVCRSVVDQSIRIPLEQFPLFKSLIRFEYVYLKSNK
jgi:hypothetical protein